MAFLLLCPYFQKMKAIGIFFFQFLYDDEATLLYFLLASLLCLC